MVHLEKTAPIGNGLGSIRPFWFKVLCKGNRRLRTAELPALLPLILLFATLFCSSGTAQTTPTVQVKTIADLVALPIPTINNRLSALVTGYWSSNDSAGGIFFFDAASSASTNLGTILKPTSAAGRWVRQFSGPINVLHFGARRDRVNGGEPFTGYIGTDSSTNFQNAIDYMLASTNLYGELRVPVGRYTWTSSVYLDGSIQLIGEGTMNSSEGIGGSHILVTSANGTGLIVGTRMVTSQDWVLEGLAFDGYTNNASYGIQIGDATHEASKGLIRKVSARKFNGSGIRVISCNTMLIEKCDLYAQSGTGGAALLFDYVSGGSINAITTIGNHLSGGTDGWRILNGHGIVSMGDVIEGITGAGILMRDTSANPGRITHNTFIGTWMEQNGTNIVAYYPGVSRTMIDNVFDGLQLRSITSTNQVVIGNGTFAFYNTRMGGGENMVMRGMTSAIIHWHQNNTNGTWFVDSDASNPTVVNYVTQDGRLTGIGTQNPLWRLHLSNVTDTARIGLDSSNIIGSVVRTGPAVSGANVSDGISLSAGTGLGASLVPNNGGSWGLTVTSTNISYGTASPNPNAVFDLVSPGNNKAFMPPRMTQAQRDAISLPTAGMVIYQNDGSTGIYFYNGTVWTNSGALPAAFTGAPYIMQANDGSFSAERALTGTANQVVLTDGGANGAMTLSLPQNIHTSAAPQFLSETLVNDNGASDGLAMTRYSGGGSGSLLKFSFANNTLASPNNVINGDVLGNIQFTGYNGGGFDSGALAWVEVDGAPPDANNVKSKWVFTVNNGAGGGTTSKAVIDSNGIFANAGMRFNRRALAITGSVLEGDYYIACTAGAITVTLPDSSTYGTGKVYIIKDVSGVAAASNIVLDPTGADTIDGGATYTIAVNFRAVTLISDGANNYEIVSVSP